MPTPAIEGLKSALIANNILAGRCTIAVFVGLLVEYIILFWTKRKELSRTEFGLTIAAAVLIAGGVYGEYFFGSKASDAAMKIEGVSEQRARDMDLETARVTAETARLTGENLRLQAEIIARTASRHLTREQEKRVAAQLLPFAGQKFKLFGYGADAEIVEFANEFLYACCNEFAGGRWAGSMSNVPVGPLTGIMILIRPDADERSRKAADALALALRNEHLTVAGPRSESDHRTALKIVANQPFIGALDPANPITIAIGHRK